MFRGVSAHDNTKTNEVLEPGGKGKEANSRQSNNDRAAETRFLPLVIGTASPAREARGTFVIIDRTGLVHETGRVVKNYKIEAVRPDVIVTIERRSELAPIRTANRHLPIITVEPSRKAHGKDDYERIEMRRRSYARHFAGATSFELSLESLICQRTLLFAGKPIELEGAVHAEKSSEGILIIGAPVAPPPDSKVLPAGFERNLLSGIADSTGRCLRLGIIERNDFTRRTIALTTPVECDKVRIIQFGDLFVTPERARTGQVGVVAGDIFKRGCRALLPKAWV